MSRKLDALYAMAGQDGSPAERDIARAKLEAMGAWPPPPRPPAPPVAGAPMPFSWHAWSGTGTVNLGSASFTTTNVRIVFERTGL